MSGPGGDPPNADEGHAEPDGRPGSSKTLARHLVEWILVLAVGIGVYAGLRTFLVQAFSIPSTSMTPTLEVGDRVLVNKLADHADELERGDIIVFRRPEGICDDEIADLIKRVVGVPGDAITFEDGFVYIDGRKLTEPYLAGGTVTSGRSAPFPCTPESPCVVPEGHVWVMGDNRSGSCDSRYFGPVAEDAIVGRAAVRMWPPSRLERF